MCIAIIDTLMDKFVSLPQGEDCLNIAKGFYQEWNFPNCLGAIDLRHFEIKPPSHSGTFFFNYKKFFSVGLLAACDAYKRFLFADVGSYGNW